MPTPSPITAFGETHSAAEWGKRRDLHRATIMKRIQSGLSPEQALEPVAKRNSTWIKERWQGASTLPWSADDKARELVEEQGAQTLEEIGQIMGATKERIRQIEEKALRKLYRHCKRTGQEFELRSMLRTIATIRDSREYTYPAPVDYFGASEHGNASRTAASRRNRQKVAA